MKSWLLLFIIDCDFVQVNASTLLQGLSQKSNKDKYDFTKEKVINDLREFTISTTDSTIIFDPVYGKIDAPLHYRRNLNNFNFDGVYKIINSRNQSILDSDG